MSMQQFTSEVITPKTHKVVLYFVNETELKILERGSTSSLYLTFGLALLSTFVSFAIVLSSTPIQSDRVFYVFFIIASVSFVSSFVLLALWRRTENETASTIKAIRDRFPEGERSESTSRYDVEIDGGTFDGITGE
ncbi:hypothetical protein G3480_06130 [Thiorhodococcus mannitoliphagus]|uniref:Uncharacterized protein n=1 Tax=Thiorhodococcus mannitoliphagus TaxID=329406 RepID=A0A6P1DT79_9GAMM|nr:hypothetical protein [Thiorhodococcus mannitoliphagus]NEX19896.1 hypothetical protein [Thiorhodococcus mannitoliphagus]